MMRLNGTMVLLAFMCVAGLSACTKAVKPLGDPLGGVQVQIRTEVGNIDLTLDTLNAPVTAKNFLRYVDAGLFAGGSFYRTVTMDNQPNNDILIEVIQGGINRDRHEERFPAIPLERTNKTGILHRNGVISMARSGPDTGTSEIFICIGDQPSLDFGGMRNPDGQGFAAFGRVTQGMDVVRAIQKAPVEKQRLTPAIKILEVIRR